MLRILSIAAVQPLDMSQQVTYEIGFLLAFLTVFLPLMGLTVWIFETLIPRKRKRPAHVRTMDKPRR